MTTTVFVNTVTLTDAGWFNDVDSVVYPGAGAIVAGVWTTPAFSAGNFTGSSSMTWTVGSGDVETYEYAMVGKMMTVLFSINTTTVGGTPDTALKIAIPGSKVAAKAAYNAMAVISDNSSLTTGNARVSAGGTTIQIFRTDAANWTASTDATSVRGQITFEIQ